jgi:clan AA aspartic protease (TIGR02281 family)
MGSVSAAVRDLSISRYRLDKEGGVIEVQATHPGDKETRDRVRRELSEEARKGIPSATPEMQQHQKEIRYRYENTEQGGRIRIIAKSREALLAVQDFLHTQITGASGDRKVAFDFVDNTSLVVVPVRINGHGPYRFLLDTGASSSILSLSIAEGLGIPRARAYTIITAGGNVSGTVRKLSALTVGNARLEDVEIAVANVPLLKTMNVDGVLGSDYLRRFKISIDYDNQVVDIEPCCPETMSRVVA